MTKASRRFSSSVRAGALCLALAAGCTGLGPTVPSRPVTAPDTGRVAPAASQLGPSPAQILSVNSDLGFVVIDFGSRLIPPVGTRLDVFRDNKEIGAVRITEPVQAQLATADIIQGELRAGDEAR
jgi:hypothetical protein